MVVRVDVEPALLHWAVNRAGWDAQTVQSRAPHFSEWASGTRRPTLKQLEKFANDTHTPMGLLFLAEPPFEDVPIPDMRTLGNAVLRAPSADLLDTIYQCQVRQDWYRSFAQVHQIPGPPFVGAATTKSDPMVVADQIRMGLRFGVEARSEFPNWEGALRELIDRIEHVGVLVMVNGVVGSNTHRKLDPEEFRGFALADRIAPLIFVNGADTKAAQIFTLVHELAHIWLGGSALSDAALAARSAVAEETWCNDVAAEVLLPMAHLQQDYRGDSSTEELERLAKKYRVSTLVVLRRLFDAGFLKWDQYRDWYARELARVMAFLARRGDQAGGNYYYTQPLRISRRFSQAVIASALEGETSYRDAYSLLETKKHSTFANLASELVVA